MTRTPIIVRITFQHHLFICPFQLGFVALILASFVSCGDDGSYKHDPSGDTALPYHHDTTGDQALPYNHDPSGDQGRPYIHEESPGSNKNEVKQHEDTTDQKTRQTIHDDPLAGVVCEEDEEGEEEYVVPDPIHCDRYLVCPLGEVEVCGEGETLDTETGYCDERGAVDCGTRRLNIRDNMKVLELRLESRVQKILRSG